MNDAYIEVGDAVQVNERWTTTATNRGVGIVKRVFRSHLGGTWAAVRFETDTEETMCMVRELDPAPRPPAR